jgi:hypothetical protein
MPNAYTVSQVLDFLQAATLEPAKLPEAISALQVMVWKSKGWDSGLSEEVVETLSGLAYDLDFYEPHPAARAEDASFFAADRALQEIANALRRIHPR